MRWIVLFAALLTAAPMFACLNDRDTRRMQKEAKPDDPMQGLPPIPQVLRGRFDRYPTEYYAMRVKRVEKDLAADPAQYALYDDIAVALDRTGDDDAAIQWMEKKLALLEANRDENNAEWQEHWYSYHANLGTFYAHRWFHGGADRANMDDLLKGRELIAKALEIKPNAHFGRERYQHMAMDWIANGPEFNGKGLPNMLGLEQDEITGSAGDDVLKAKGLDDAVQGISGLIVLGAAWESVDATYALGLALRLKGDDVNAYVALLRCKELIEQGRGSLVANAPAGETLVQEISKVLPPPSDNAKAVAAKQNFKNQREIAEEWRADRNAKISELLASGRHPDTDGEFWNEVNGLTRPNQFNEPAGESGDTWLWIGLGALAVVGLGGATFTLVRRNRSDTEVKPTDIGRRQADSHSA